MLSMICNMNCDIYCNIYISIFCSEAVFCIVNFVFFAVRYCVKIIFSIVSRVLTFHVAFFVVE